MEQRRRLTMLQPRVQTQSTGGWLPDQQRGNRHARGYGWEWEKTRKRIIARDEGLCQPCLRNGRTAVFQAVDHIIPKARGGSDDDANLQCICDDCHKAKTARESNGTE